MDIFVVVSAWHVADLQAAATEVPLSAASQHVGYYTATGCQLRSASISFTYCSNK